MKENSLTLCSLDMKLCRLKQEIYQTDERRTKMTHIQSATQLVSAYSYTINFRYKNVTQSRLFFAYKNITQSVRFFVYKNVRQSELFFQYKNVTQIALFFAYKNVPTPLRQFQKFHEKSCNTKCPYFCIYKRNANCLTFCEVSCFL